MGSINTEEAARRLARVILSDIELYNRERPKPGETLEGQIEEGRKLFASRVTPDLLPLFGQVLSDRALAKVNSPTAAEPPPAPASTTAAVGPADASPAPDPMIQDQLTPAPALAAPPLEDQRTPAPTLAAPPLVRQPALTARVAPPPLASGTPAVLAQARPAAPPAPEIPIPVLTARFSIPKLLAIVSVVAATVAVLYQLLA